MDIIQKYIEINEKLRGFLDIDSFYEVDFLLDQKWEGEKDYVTWGPDETGDYDLECRAKIEVDGYTTFLAYSDFGGMIYMVFDNKNKV